MTLICRRRRFATPKDASPRWSASWTRRRFVVMCIVSVMCVVCALCACVCVCVLAQAGQHADGCGRHAVFVIVVACTAFVLQDLVNIAESKVNTLAQENKGLEREIGELKNQVYMYVCMYVFMCVCVYIYLYRYIYVLDMMYVYMHVCYNITRARARAHTHTHTHTL